MTLDIGEGTIAAARAARSGLAHGARQPGERAMGALAQRALFDEALLGAIKARVAEVKAVAK